MATFNDYLETFKGMAVEGAQTAVKKTRQLASVAKANLAIRTEEEKIKKAQIELGKLYYKDYIVGQTPDPAVYTPWCERISESKIAIEDLKIAIEELRNEGCVEDDETVTSDDYVVDITEDDLVSESTKPAEAQPIVINVEVVDDEDKKDEQE